MLTTYSLFLTFDNLNSVNATNNNQFNNNLSDVNNQSNNGNNLSNLNENISNLNNKNISDVNSMLNNAPESVNLGNVSQYLIDPTLNNNGGHTQYEPLSNIEVNNGNSNIDISKLNELIKTINEAIVYEYNDSKAYDEFLNFYENIFEQAQQLGFIEPSKDKNEFMYALICNMLYDEFDLATFKYFTTINDVHKYFNEQYRDDVYRFGLLKRLNNNELLTSEEYIHLLALYMWNRPDSINLVFRINFNSIILQLVKNIINVMWEINKKNQMSKQNNEELDKILLSLEKNFTFAKLQLAEKHQEIYNKVANFIAVTNFIAKDNSQNLAEKHQKIYNKVANFIVKDNSQNLIDPTIYISKLNELIKTINEAILHEYNDSQAYAKFLNFYENIFNQAQQLGFIEPSKDQNKFMDTLIHNMLNEDFSLDSLKYFASLYNVRKYFDKQYRNNGNDVYRFDKQYKNDVYRSGLLKRLNNDEPLSKTDYISLLEPFLCKRSSNIYNILHIDFNNIILRLVHSIISKMNTENNEELHEIKSSLMKNFELVKLKLTEKNQNIRGKKDININSIQFFDKYVKKLENVKNKDFSNLNYRLNKIYKNKNTQDFIKTMNTIILHADVKQNVDEYIKVYNLIFNAAQQLGFIEPSTDKNKFMDTLICNMLNENFSLDALKYFIQHPEVYKYLESSDEYSPEQKDLIKRLNNNETLQKKEYTSLLSTIFVKWPVVMSKLKINYKNVILKLINIIDVNITNYFKTKKKIFEFKFENKNNYEMAGKMTAFLSIMRQNIYSDLINLNEICTSEKAKLTKENKEIKTHASHTNNFNNNNNIIDINENVNITDNIYNAYLSNNNKFKKFKPQKVNLSDDENNILQNNENVPNIFDKSSLLNNSLNKYSNINLSNSITQNLNLTIDSNQSNNLNKNNIISTNSAFTPMTYQNNYTSIADTYDKYICPVKNSNKTSNKNYNIVSKQFLLPIINQIKNDDDNSNTTKNFEKSLQKKHKYDTINMFNLNSDEDFSNYNINNNKPSNIWKKLDNLNNNNNPLKITNVLNRNIDISEISNENDNNTSDIDNYSFHLEQSSKKMLQQKRKNNTKFANQNIDKINTRNLFNLNNNNNPLKITNVLNRNIDMPTNVGNYGNDMLTQNSNINYIRLSQENIGNLINNKYDIQCQNPGQKPSINCVNLNQKNINNLVDNNLSILTRPQNSNMNVSNINQNVDLDLTNFVNKNIKNTKTSNTKIKNTKTSNTKNKKH